MHIYNFTVLTWFTLKPHTEPLGSVQLQCVLQSFPFSNDHLIHHVLTRYFRTTWQSIAPSTSPLWTPVKTSVFQLWCTSAPWAPHTSIWAPGGWFFCSDLNTLVGVILLLWKSQRGATRSKPREWRETQEKLSGSAASLLLLLSRTQTRVKSS